MMFDTSIDINGAEYDIRVWYEYFRGVKGKRNSYGVPMEPDDPASVEISKVELNYGDLKKPDWKAINLPDDVVEDIENEILEHY